MCLIWGEVGYVVWCVGRRYLSWLTCAETYSRVKSRGSGVWGRTDTRLCVDYSASGEGSGVVPGLDSLRSALTSVSMAALTLGGVHGWDQWMIWTV